MSDGAAAYWCVGQNRLIERCDYTYTPYLGPDFLRAYRAQRRGLRDALRAARGGLVAEETFEVAVAKEVSAAFAGVRRSGMPSPLHDRLVRVLPAGPGAIPFVTQDVLTDLWQASLHFPNRWPDECAAWLAALEKRFEVSKRLYTAYRAPFRPATQDYQRLESYALLGTLLAFVYRQEGNVKHLNTMLKLVDLLSSVPRADRSAATEVLLLALIEAELEAVEALVGAHGIVV